MSVKLFLFTVFEMSAGNTHTTPESSCSSVTEMKNAYALRLVQDSLPQELINNATVNFTLYVQNIKVCISVHT